MSKTDDRTPDPLDMLDQMQFCLSLSQSKKDSLFVKMNTMHTRVRDLICSRRTHSDLMLLWFKVQATGPDLGNIELKENINIRHEYMIYPKDLESEYLVFYDHRFNQWCMLHRNLIKHLIRSKRSINHKQILLYSQLTTKEDAVIMRRIKELCKFPELLNY